MERGRRPDASIDVDLEYALSLLLAEGDISRVTVRQLTRTAGRNVPAFYRRYDGMPAFLVTVLVTRYSSTVSPETGAVLRDLEAIRDHHIEVFTDSFVPQALPVVVSALNRSGQTRELFREGFLVPGRASVKGALLRGEACDGIRSDIDVDAVHEALIGPVVLAALIPDLFGSLRDRRACLASR